MKKIIMLSLLCAVGAAQPARNLASVHCIPASQSLDGERMPSFKGGSVALFRTWIVDRLVWPETVACDAAECPIRNQVVVSFKVQADGTVSEPEFETPIAPALADVLRDLFADAPRWSPALQYNARTGAVEPKEVRFRLPVDFGPAYKKAHKKARKRGRR